MWLFLALIAVPLIEIALFIQVGGLIGLWPTLAIVILTAFIGTWLVRSQGAMAMNNLRQSFSNMDDPTEHLAQGAMILFSGVLLLTPGFFTDTLGFTLLVPGVRHAVFRFLRKRVHVQKFGTGPGPGSRHPRDNSIETEYHEIDPESDERGNSGWTKH